MDELVDLTRRLVSIPSHVDETAAGDAVESWLREHTDAAVTRDDDGNVIARRTGGSPTKSESVVARRGEGGESLAFVGHHDVVPPDDTQVDGGEYVVAERDGRLYGRGTADMKGSLAAAMLAFRDSEAGAASNCRTASDDAEPTPELVFASFVGEEAGGVGARAAIGDVSEVPDSEARESGPGSRGGFVPDYAVVGEGSTGYSAAGVTDVAVAHKGRRGSTIVARGTAAHASEPAAGDNAVYRACDAVDRVRDLDTPETTVLGHEMRGSVAVTEIDGGSAWNVIPERCEVTVDERTVPGERADLDGVAAEGVELRVDQDLPPMACDDGAFADLVRDAARDAYGAGGDADRDSDGDGAGGPQLVTKPHATDAGWLADAGTTCVVCGAAEPGEAHTADESVSLDALERCYRIYRGVAESLGR